MLQWKRDYGSSWDADCVIVGVRHGRGGRQVGLRSYLCALLLPASAGSSSKVLVTFTRVSSGLNVRNPVSFCPRNRQLKARRMRTRPTMVVRLLQAACLLSGD